MLTTCSGGHIITSVGHIERIMMLRGIAILLTLSACTVYRGVVVDAGTGAPVGGAEVHAITPHKKDYGVDTLGQCTSRPDGRFSISTIGQPQAISAVQGGRTGAVFDPKTTGQVLIPIRRNN